MKYSSNVAQVWQQLSFLVLSFNSCQSAVVTHLFNWLQLFSRRGKTLNHFAIMVRNRIKGAEGGDDEAEAEPGEKKKKGKKGKTLVSHNVLNSGSNLICHLSKKSFTHQDPDSLWEQCDCFIVSILWGIILRCKSCYVRIHDTIEKTCYQSLVLSWGVHVLHSGYINRCCLRKSFIVHSF